MTKTIKGFMILVCILTILTSTAYASVNGFFLGFPVINVVVDGKQISGDVPAINFNGRTMVPVKFISEELGADVRWDGNTATAYISSGSIVQNPTTVAGGYSQSDIDRIKMYSAILDHYKWIEDLGKNLVSTHDNLSLSINEVHLFGTNDSFSTTEEYLSARIDMYNQILPYTQNIITNARSYGLDISDMNTILNHYSDAIDSYIASFESASSYSYTGSERDFNNYLNHGNKANDSMYRGLYPAGDGYHKYSNMIQEF